MFYFGTHYSKGQPPLDKAINSAFDDILSLGGNMIQIFISNPMGRHKKDFIGKFSNYGENIKKILKKRKCAIVIHSPYLLNLAKKVISPQEAYWIKAFYEELIVADMIGAIGCVIHVGKALELSEDISLNYMFLALKYLIKEVKENNLKVKIILETAAGQGTELLSNLHHLAIFYNKFSTEEKKILKICIDTCHIFSAGHDIRKKEQVDTLFKNIKKDFGMKNIALIHLNDSKREFNSHVDRHEKLGFGKIGLEGLKRFIDYAYRYKIPIILETPNNGYLKEIPLIKKTISH